MAQIEPQEGGKKKKGAQKKMHIHVDFTPMVDMNMLLITFFMLCTTMIKSQTLQIQLPAPIDPNDTSQQAETIAESRAITMIVDTKRDAEGNIEKDEDGNQINVVYYFKGEEPIDSLGNITDHDKLKAEYFLANDGSAVRGIRAILYAENKDFVDKLKVYKDQFANEKITKQEFDSIAKEMRKDTIYKQTSPQVSIKATSDASWQSVIAALDEMQINQISQYRIGTFSHNDSILVDDYIKRNQ